MSGQHIVVVDYGTGNLRSVAKALEFVAIGHCVQITSQPEDILNADRVVFPGQGAAADCMQALREANLVDVIRDVVGSRPFLGICMGLQVLFEHSDENGGVDCIGALNGCVRRFPGDLRDAHNHKLKVPHMGWNRVSQGSNDTGHAHSLWAGIADEAHFYFAHSFVCDPADEAQVVGVTDYGGAIPVAFAARQLFAVQFHPEKSSGNGLQLLRNFIDWSGH